MADLIDYGQVKNAAKDANVDVKAELTKLSNDMQNLIQQVNAHSNRLDNLQSRFGPINNLQQQLTNMERKIDQLTNNMQAIISRLP